MNKERFWKIIALISCALLLVVCLTSFTSALPNSQYYNICTELDDIEQALSKLNRSLSDLSGNLSGIENELFKIRMK